MVTEVLEDTSKSLLPELPVQGVKVVAVKGKGRGLVATKAFHVGDVLVEEAPYAAVVSLHEMDSACSGDLSHLDTAAASKCNGCKRLRSLFLHPLQFNSRPSALYYIYCVLHAMSVALYAP